MPGDTLVVDDLTDAPAYQRREPETTNLELGFEEPRQPWPGEAG